MRDDVRLGVFKALGDNTRYAIYLELARSPLPMSTADIAQSLDLHVNTVRPHLERMREIGLLDVEPFASGGVGRPQNRYRLSQEAPSLGLEPPAYPLAARLLLGVAAAAGASAEDAVDIGRAQGGEDFARFGSEGGCVNGLLGRQSALGFDPAMVESDGSVTVAFTRCAFADLAQANPAVVCSLHRGLVEGFVEAAGEQVVTDFRTLVDRDGCQVDLTSLVGLEIAEPVPLFTPGNGEIR